MDWPINYKVQDFFEQLEVIQQLIKKFTTLMEHKGT